MPYPKTVWENLPSQDTPINAANLNKIEDQLELVTNAMPIPLVDYVDFVQNPTASIQLGRLMWSLVDDTLSIGHSGGVIQQVGEETYARVTNNTGSVLNDGDLIGLTGTGTTVGKYIADGTLPPIYALGLATQQIAIGQRGRLTTYGRVRGLNTSAYVVGDTVYASATVAGGLTKVKPTAPNIVIPIGVVTSISATDGEIFVRPILDQQLYYGSFSKTVDTSPAVINTAYPIVFDATTVANGVHIGSTASRITVDHSGLYNFNASFQLTSTNATVKNVFMWFRKNGVDVPSTTLIRSLDSGTAVAVQNRSMFFSLAAGDYIELMWASDNTNVLLDARAATGFCPSAPSVALAVDQIQQ